jgi:hypothetical protein
MSDFYELDFLDVESAKSGDAIALRYELNGETFIHVVDGGVQDTGDKVVEHLRQYYGNPGYIDRVVASHPDGDHTGGLRTVLNEFAVGELWMLRPWLYAAEVIGRFSRFSSVENLQKHLREIYPNIAALEEIATAKGIPIHEPFQGAALGSFRVLAPTKARYLNLLVESKRTPESMVEAEKSVAAKLGVFLEKTATRAISLLKAAWGEEAFSSEETSAENEMSIVQYANLCGYRLVLTADVGRAGLNEAAIYAPHVGLALPGVHRFQVPHHGSRRNVSTEVLDCWLGPRLPSKPASGTEKFTAIISSARLDEDHPRKAVIRALVHRGAIVLTTEGKNLCISQYAPQRQGWVPAIPVAYPEQQEE